MKKECPVGKHKHILTKTNQTTVLPTGGVARLCKYICKNCGHWYYKTPVRSKG